MIKLTDNANTAEDPQDPVRRPSMSTFRQTDNMVDVIVLEVYAPSPSSNIMENFQKKILLTVTPSPLHTKPPIPTLLL